mmetsp:Transcript_99098/g.263343  ORF Transcript_99098/g.263343 Transcript_99098/m.263343 type:complete len:215 (-) Transcript_99098:71-715(-)
MAATGSSSDTMVSPLAHELPRTRLAMWLPNVDTRCTATATLSTKESHDMSPTREPTQEIQQTVEEEEVVDAVPRFVDNARRLTEEPTTWVVRNFPGPYSAAHVLDVWPVEGAFRYIEIPYDVAAAAFKGFVVIDFETPELGHHFAAAWDGRFLTDIQRSPLRVRPGRIQGPLALLERFRGKNLQKLSNHRHLPLLFSGTLRLSTRDVLQSLFGQ